jgi:hypothetical protein
MSASIEGKDRNQATLFPERLAAILFAPNMALAQSRGGSCHTSFCQFTGGGAMLVLIAAFSITLAESIRRPSFIGTTQRASSTVDAGRFWRMSRDVGDEAGLQ